MATLVAIGLPSAAVSCACRIRNASSVSRSRAGLWPIVRTRRVTVYPYTRAGGIAIVYTPALFVNAPTLSSGICTVAAGSASPRSSITWPRTTASCPLASLPAAHASNTVHGPTRHQCPRRGMVVRGVPK